MNESSVYILSKSITTNLLWNYYEQKTNKLGLDELEQPKSFWIMVW